MQNSKMESTLIPEPEPAQQKDVIDLTKDCHVLDCKCNNCWMKDKEQERCKLNIPGVNHTEDCECSYCVTDSDSDSDATLEMPLPLMQGRGKGLMVRPGMSPPLLIRQNAVCDGSSKRKAIQVNDSDEEPEPKKLKPEQPKEWRGQTKILCLTFPQTGDAWPKDIAENFQVRCSKVCGRVVVVRETHKDGNFHHHLYAEAAPGKKFDIKGNWITIGGRIYRFNAAKTHQGGATSEKGWVKYMLKTLDVDCLDQSENFWTNIPNILEWLEDKNDIISKICSAATPVEAIRIFADENGATDAVKAASQVTRLWEISHAANPSYEMNKIQSKWMLAHYDERVALLATFIRRWVLTEVVDERQPVLIFVGPSRVGKTVATRSFLEFVGRPYCYFRQGFSWAVLRDHAVKTGPIILDDMGDDELFGWSDAKKPPTAVTERNTVITVTDKYAKKFQLPLIGRPWILLCNKVPQWVVSRQHDSLVEPAYWGEITGNINILALPDLRPLFYTPESPEYEDKSPIARFFE